MTNELKNKIEALLFYHAEPMELKELAKLTGASTREIETVIEELTSDYKDRGVTLMKEGDRYMFATAASVGEFLKKIIQEENTRDLGKAGLETLAVILYRGPVTRSEVDHIRGVNSSFIVRNLLIRGLIERVPNPKDSRSFLYRSSFELLQHLGVSQVSDLPGYETLTKELEAVPQEETEKLDPTENE